MTWNHRVVKRVIGEEAAYSIHEVYYAEDGTITGWTADAVHPFGESVQELRDDLTHFIRAVEKPILIEARDEIGVEHLIEATD